MSATSAQTSAPLGIAHGTVLLVANYRPDVGFAWWLMEHFWVRAARLAGESTLQTLLAYPETGEIPETIRAARIEHVVLPVPGAGLRGLFRTVRLVRARKVRLVYFTDRAFTSLTYLSLRLAGVRCIVTHDHTPGDRPAIGGVKGVLKAMWRRVPMLSADLHVSVSPLIRERAVRNARIPAVRCAVVQNGIAPVRGTGDREYARRTFALRTDAIICMTVARANPYKRIDFVIEVARLCVVERRRTDMVFVFCGDGPDLERLRRLADSSGIGNHFIFAGRRTDIRPLLGSADLALHPSKGEAFSLAIVEYMSAGLPLLVPDIPTVCQAVVHGESGFVYPDGDAQAAALACRLADDAAERRRIGAQASQAVDAHFSMQGMDAQFDDVIGGAIRSLTR
jgi:glycosyltransferase involved in cell wall biosynthesis